MKLKFANVGSQARTFNKGYPNIFSGWIVASVTKLDVIGNNELMKELQHEGKLQ